jgi:hypothetical protein
MLLAKWKGGFIARECKPAVPSACVANSNKDLIITYHLVNIVRVAVMMFASLWIPCQATPLLTLPRRCYFAANHPGPYELRVADIIALSRRCPDPFFRVDNGWLYRR